MTPKLKVRFSAMGYFRQRMGLGREVGMNIVGRKHGRREKKRTRKGGGGGLQHIQKELLNLSESTGSSPERILIKLWTFVIHYLETTYAV